VTDETSLNQYVGHSKIPAFEAAGWRVEVDLSGIHHGAHAVLMTRDMPAIEENKITLVSPANVTAYGEIDLPVLVNGKELVLTMRASVAGAFISSIARALAER